MGLFELFSKRQKKLEKVGQPDTYQYTDLPESFRMQVLHVWRTAIGLWCYDRYHPSVSNQCWDFIHETLCREYGKPMLGTRERDNLAQRCVQHFLEADSDQALDIIELSFKLIDGKVRESHDYNITQGPDSAIEELNHRFRENGIGFQFEGHQLVKIDSQYIHAEVVRPALSLLQEANFLGPEREFLQAHEHYRAGKNADAITWALKAFESTMKAVCDKRKWPYPNNATAKSLIDVIFSKGLVPQQLTSHFSSLRSLLESGLPTVRNTSGGHGQGKDPVLIPEYLASYALHQAASNIVFLINAHKNS